MSDEYPYWYVPVDDEAAQLILAMAANQCGARVCPVAELCHRQCSLLMGRPPDDAYDDTGETVRLLATLLCDRGNEYTIDQGRRHDDFRSITEGVREIVVPAAWVKPAGTLKERAGRQLMEGMHAAAQDDDSWMRPPDDDDDPSESWKTTD